MRLDRWLSGIGVGTLAVAALFAAPALRAQESAAQKAMKRQTVELNAGIGTFTPSAGDPKLAAMLARSGMPASSFRFTPSESRRPGSTALTVAMRTPTRAVALPTSVTQAPQSSVSMAPIAYNLGVSSGWKRFAVSSDAIRTDVVTLPLGRDYSLGSTVKHKVQGGEGRGLTGVAQINVPAMISDKGGNGDLSGSYSLNRHFDLTAGIRTKSDKDRLPSIGDNRRENQAVYVGTAFRF